MTSRVFRKYINITLVGYGLVLIPWMIITNFSGHEVAENFSLEEIRTLTEKYRYTPLANRR